MPLHSLRLKSYHRWRIEEPTPPGAFERDRKLNKYARLRAEGCSVETALNVLGCSRTTLWRWRRRAQGGVPALADRSSRPRRIRRPTGRAPVEHHVWTLRLPDPFMGRLRGQGRLRRAGVRVSASTLGRILAKGVRLHRIQPCAFCRGRRQPQRHRDFRTGHAQRWRYGSPATRPGDLGQLDHMPIHRDGHTLKAFKAISPVGKWRGARVYARAPARSATRFLEAVAADMPLHSVPGDGGSEFMAEFEQSCEANGLPLFVLPPRRPQWNGVVERTNDTPGRNSGVSTLATSPSPRRRRPWPSMSASTTRSDRIKL